LGAEFSLFSGKTGIFGKIGFIRLEFEFRLIV